MVTCGLCGYTFDAQDQGCHAGCPLAAWQGCALVCCPQCGYQMVDERQSNGARLLKRLWPARPDAKPELLETGH
jgi:hypothetical protein